MSTTSPQPNLKPVSVSVYPSYKSPPHLPRPPFVEVDGIPNFRDLGGYLCSPYGQHHSHVVRPSLIYRCALPNLITPTGMTTITQTLKVKTFYDLRSTPEVARTAAATPNPTTVSLQALRQFTPVYTSEDYGPDALARKLKWYSAPDSNPNARTLTPSQSTSLPPYSLGFLNAYRDISIHGISAYRTIFTQILADPSSPLVFHCTAGKDRTGVLAGLILRLCGVDDDTICWEYALTEPGLGSWRDVFMKRMSINGLAGDNNSNSNSNTDHESLTLEEASRICGSRSGNMRAFLKLVLDAELGGVENYMISKLGFSVQDVEKIRFALLIPVDEVDENRVVKVVSIPGWTPEGGVEDGFVREPTEEVNVAV